MSGIKTDEIIRALLVCPTTGNISICFVATAASDWR